MNIDIESINQVLSTFRTVITIIKNAKDLLPEKEKQEVGSALEKAERQLKIAESQSAQALGYRICRNHFPPEIMLSNNNKDWKCPLCGNETKHQDNKKASLRW
jgi:hypothetical protein